MTQTDTPTPRSIAIETDAQMNRHYIPIGAGWEIQTKGSGSTFRIANLDEDGRMLILDKHLHARLERMAREVNAELTTLREQLAQYESDGPDGRKVTNHQFVELREQLAAVSKDAERLDWIERKLFDHKWNGVIDSGSQTQWTIAGPFRHVTQQMIGNTFRDAIDAAIAASKEQALDELSEISEKLGGY